MKTERIGVGPRMSQAVIHGDTVYLAGQAARDARGALSLVRSASVAVRLRCVAPPREPRLTRGQGNPVK